MEKSFDTLKETPIRNVMNKRVVTVHKDEDFSEVHRKFIDNNATHLIVIDRENRVGGMISQKYLYKTQSPRKVVSEEMEYHPDLLRDGKDSFYTKDMLDSYILSRIMQPNPLTLLPEATVGEAILHMANKKLGCIPVVDKDHKIQGVLTHFEIINFFSRYCS